MTARHSNFRRCWSLSAFVAAEAVIGAAVVVVVTAIDATEGAVVVVDFSTVDMVLVVVAVASPEVVLAEEEALLKGVSELDLIAGIAPIASFLVMSCCFVSRVP